MHAPDARPTAARWRPRTWQAGVGWGLLVLLALPVLALLAVALFGLNWARGPLQDLALERTGRELRIAGDLSLDLGWHPPRLQARGVSFANPAWATAPRLFEADAVTLAIDLRELLRGRLVLPEVHLSHPRVALEQGSGGRKTWLLDPTQTDESARIHIGRLRLDEGVLHYTDAARDTAVQAELSTTLADGAASGAASAAAPGEAPGITFKAAGTWHGQALTAAGQGGALLALRDTTQPYALRVKATVGRTQVAVEGSVTGLLTLDAVDLQLDLRGDSAASLLPLIGIALPRTPAYRTTGRLLRRGTMWRYEGLRGVVGRSDLAGTLQLETAGTRPLLSGELDSRRLDLADLGPAVGVRPAAAGGTAAVRWLPELPFDTARWSTLNADVVLRAASLLHGQALPLDKLNARLRLLDSRLELDPLEFGVAGGRLLARVTLDGSVQPMRGQAKVRLRGLQLGRLLPTVDLSRASLGRLDGEADLAGRGESVGGMLATADGRLSLVAENGEISRLLMEQIGLHLLEMLHLQLTGDEPVRLRCAVADFEVAAGVMHTRALVLDTAVSTLIGSGRIDLAQERFDLTIEPRTKVTSLVALRSPIHLRGSFARPEVSLDTARVAARGAGALALALINPLLALIPLVEAGPGADSECGRLIAEARTALPKSRP